MGEARFATWLAKPDGMSYPIFFDRMAEATEAKRTDLWRRQLTLGPSPEFCTHSTSRLRLPKAFSHTTVSIAPVSYRVPE